MTRLRSLLLALCLLPFAAFAQSTLNVSFTYTAGAIAAAGSESALQTHIGNQIAAINAQYAADGIQVILTGSYGGSGNTAPSDSRDQFAQYQWVKNAPTPWRYRGYGDGSSISVQVSTSSGSAVFSTNPTGHMRESTIAIPYSELTTALEGAISRILGSTIGWSDRVRVYAGDNGTTYDTTYCYHTREHEPSDQYQSVQFASFYTAEHPSSPHPALSQTKSSTPQNACTAFMYWYRGQSGGSATIFATAEITGGNLCVLKNTSGGSTANSPLTYTGPGGSAMITCSSEVAHGYSKNGNMAGAPYAPLGNSVADSVGKMNIRRFDVGMYATRGTEYAKGLEAIYFRGYCLLNCPP